MLSIRNLNIEALADSGTTSLLSLEELTVDRGEVVTLMGASGVGKSTLLRWVLGEPLPHFSIQGELRLNEKAIGGRTIAERQLGMMFQKGGLFPHLTVGENCLFAQKARSTLSVKQQNEKASTMLSKLGLAEKWTNYPDSLSGGQYARIALICALLAEPQAMLLDEPFSALDANLREEVRQWTFTQLQERKIPTLLVTHDRADARGRILKIEQGEIQEEVANV